MTRPAAGGGTAIVPSETVATGASTSGDETARSRVRDDLTSTLFVEAGAGTGKTTALVGRIVSLVSSGEASMRQIAAITFTEAAAAELRRRVRQDLESAADAARADAVSAPEGSGARERADRLADAAAEVDEATICTLHAFARSILAEHCIAAGLPPGFDVLDGTDDRVDFDERWIRFLDQLLRDPEAEHVLRRGRAVGLRWSDLQHIALCLHDNWDRLADVASRCTGGNAGEVDLFGTPCAATPAVDASPIVAALELAIGKTDACLVTDDALFDLLEGDLTEALHRLRQVIGSGDEEAVLNALTVALPSTARKGRKENWSEPIDQVRTLCGEAEELRSEIVDAVRHRVLVDLTLRIARFTLESAEERRADGRLTFHDLLVWARHLVHRDPAVRAALRDRFQRLLIDEFQDTDPVQVDLAVLLTGTTDSGLSGSAAEGADRGPVFVPGRLFMVGDPKQSIYRFRRADISLYHRVSDAIGETVTLDQNFRSVPGVLAWVNAVFAELFAAGSGVGQAPPIDLVPSRTPSSGLGRPPVVHFGAGRNAPLGDIRRQAASDMADMVATVVDEGWPISVDGDERPARWRDIAVLLPARTSLAEIERAFEEAGVPYRLEGAALLWESAEVRDLLAVLRAADDPADPVAVVAALRTPLLACGDDDLLSWYRAGGAWDPRTSSARGPEGHPVARSIRLLERFHRQRWWTEPSGLVEEILRELRCFELATLHRRPRDHWHRLRWFLDQTRLFDETVGGSLGELLTWVDRQIEGSGRSGGIGPPDPDDDAVRVLTVHGSKGLEFPVVALAGLEQTRRSTNIPAVLWNDNGRMELRAGLLATPGHDDLRAREQVLDHLEQVRLLYVAATRARDHLLVCLHHQTPKNGSSGAGSSPGDGPSHAASLTELGDGFPQLWHRWETPAGGARPVAPGLVGEVGPTAAEYPVPAGQPRDTDRMAGAGPAGDTQAPAEEAEQLTDWDARRLAWQEERRDTLERLRRQPVIAATALAEHAGEHHDAGSRSAWEVRATVDFGDPESVAGAWRAADAGLQVGRAVHNTLAAIDLATGRHQASGQPAAEVARQMAHRHRVTDHADDVVRMVTNALASPVLRLAGRRRHWKELPVVAPFGPGDSAETPAALSAGVVDETASGSTTLLEGFVDLLVEDGDDLIVADYKTDRWSGEEDLVRLAGRHRLQLVAYAEAVQAATGRSVTRRVLCFVAGEHAREVDVT